MGIDSWNEGKNAQVVLARPDVETFAVQLGPYFYGPNRKLRHFFDAGTILSDGSWHLFAVKSKRSSRFGATEEILKQLHCDDPRLAEAHLYLVSEDHLAPWQIQRARIINDALDLTDDEADETAMGAIRMAGCPVRIGAVYQETGLGHRCLAAVARLIAHGRVSMPRGALLDLNALVEAA